VSTADLRVAESLRFLGHGDGAVYLPTDATLVHVVESAGIPRTEIGEVFLNGMPAAFTDRPAAGDVIEVHPVRRPQRVSDPRFLLDVHLGTLARRMRLLGLDTAYHNDAADPALVAEAVAEHRILLTQDRGLLRRKALPMGAYVHGSAPDDQLRDVLDRFDPPLAPWTRCPACNGTLATVAKADVAHLLEPGTRRSYTEFSRCTGCGRVYWRGAHADRLDAIVTSAAGRASG
jgi:uncharacterized protein with PIN domain